MVRSFPKDVALFHTKWKRRSLVRYVNLLLFVCVPLLTAAYDWSQQQGFPTSYNPSPYLPHLPHPTRGGSLNSTDFVSASTKKAEPPPPLPTWHYEAPAVSPRSDYVQMETVEAELDDHDSTGDTEATPPITPRPVVYRYFGRARPSNRSHRQFLLLGPCADDWKETGQVLARRHGYSVMACEEVERRRGDYLVRAVLDALRWKRAVLVGCGENARTALEAALLLGPKYVAGLVLMGDLSEARAFAEKYEREEYEEDVVETEFVLDRFLQEYVECPSMIIWNGDVKSLRSGSSSSQNKRSAPHLPYPHLRTAIVGARHAPHRRLPDHFAWVLSRFVDERLHEENVPVTMATSTSRATVPSQPLFSSGSLLVTGRVVASTILYLSAMSVTIYQYQNLKCGLVDLQGHCRQLSVWRKKGIEYVLDWTKKYGLVKLMGWGRKSTVEIADVVEEADCPKDTPSDEPTEWKDNEDYGEMERFRRSAYPLFGYDSVIS